MKLMQRIGATVTVIGVATLAACGPQDTDTASPEDGSPGAGSSESQSATEQTDKTLKLLETLKTELGDSYAQGWIEEGKLHVAVTTDEAVAKVEEAGAAAKKVKFNESQLKQAQQDVQDWADSLDAEARSAVQTYAADGRNGRIVVGVHESEIAAVEKAFQQAKPAVGDGVPVVFEKTSGKISPAGG
ncbi:hypothetical protein LWF01_09295 [Saxibacter everestensis]|uniref:Lipoprotein n=1 Tax=Saxibacter everestensis TaxID=2909229 RepID=A0ABY8QY08_9MICO|nr:hypothetical protein LWF01_09295 [Brevibacteriaceae bacterium ZFBP1038]